MGYPASWAVNAAPGGFFSRETPDAQGVLACRPNGMPGKRRCKNWSKWFHGDFISHSTNKLPQTPNPSPNFSLLASASSATSKVPPIHENQFHIRFAGGNMPDIIATCLPWRIICIPYSKFQQRNVSRTLLAKENILISIALLFVVGYMPGQVAAPTACSFGLTPAKSANSAALSVFSHVKSGNSRPK